MISFKNRAVAGTAALLATVFTIAAAAPLRAETVSVPVGYGDLDIATASGQAVLLHRINRAANTVCGTADAMTRLRVAECRRQAIATARMNARLTAVDAARRDVRIAAR